MHPMTQTLSALPHRGGVWAYCSWCKITKGFQSRDVFYGKKRECGECIICLKKERLRISCLADWWRSFPVKASPLRLGEVSASSNVQRLMLSRRYVNILRSFFPRKLTIQWGEKIKRSIIKAVKIFTIRQFSWSILVWILWSRCKILKH